MDGAAVLPAMALAQSVESLTLKTDFAGSRPVGATILFANYLFKSISPTIDMHLGCF